MREEDVRRKTTRCPTIRFCYNGSTREQTTLAIPTYTFARRCTPHRRPVILNLASLSLGLDPVLMAASLVLVLLQRCSMECIRDFCCEQVRTWLNGKGYSTVFCMSTIHTTLLNQASPRISGAGPACHHRNAGGDGGGCRGVLFPHSASRCDCGLCNPEMEIYDHYNPEVAIANVFSALTLVHAPVTSLVVLFPSLAVIDSSCTDYLL